MDKGTSSAEDGVSSQTPLAPLCSICSSSSAKYCCPGCGVRTCSLGCCTEHKSTSGCSGKRDRLAFIPLQQFNDSALMSDYQLLEEVQRMGDNARRHRPPRSRPRLPKGLHILVQQARKRGTSLLLMPPGMQRRKQNTTWYSSANQELCWRVEWIFKGCSDGQEDVCVVDERVQEHTSIQQLLSSHLALQEGKASSHFKLREFVEAGPEQCVVLLREEKSRANDIRWFTIDPQWTLAQALKGKKVIEFPSFTVVLKGKDQEYLRVECQNLDGLMPNGGIASGPMQESTAERKSHGQSRDGPIPPVLEKTTQPKSHGPNQGGAMPPVNGITTKPKSHGQKQNGAMRPVSERAIQPESHGRNQGGPIPPAHETTTQLRCHGQNQSGAMPPVQEITTQSKSHGQSQSGPMPPVQEITTQPSSYVQNQGGAMLPVNEITTQPKSLGPNQGGAMPPVNGITAQSEPHGQNQSPTRNQPQTQGYFNGQSGGHSQAKPSQLQASQQCGFHQGTKRGDEYGVQHVQHADKKQRLATEGERQLEQMPGSSSGMSGSMRPSSMVASSVMQLHDSASPVLLSKMLTMLPTAISSHYSDHPVPTSHPTNASSDMSHQPPANDLGLHISARAQQSSANEVSVSHERHTNEASVSHELHTFPRYHSPNSQVGNTNRGNSLPSPSDPLVLSSPQSVEPICSPQTWPKCSTEQQSVGYAFGQGSIGLNGSQSRVLESHGAGTNQQGMHIVGEERTSKSQSGVGRGQEVSSMLDHYPHVGAIRCVSQQGLSGNSSLTSHCEVRDANEIELDLEDDG